MREKTEVDAKQALEISVAIQSGIAESIRMLVLLLELKGLTDQNEVIEGLQLLRSRLPPDEPQWRAFGVELVEKAIQGKSTPKLRLVPAE